MLHVVRPALVLGFFLLVAARGHAQPGQTTPPPLFTYPGRVVDAALHPLAGASVLVKGTGTAVSTNADGRFLLTLPAGPHTLLVDYPGYLAAGTPVAQPDSLLTIKMYSTQPRPARRR